MNTGYLTIQVTTGEDSLPIGGAEVTVRQIGGAVLYKTYTDANGNTGYFALPAPDAQLTLDPYYLQPAYSVYDVDISAPGYMICHVHDVGIVDTQTAILPVDMHPLLEEADPETDEDIDLPPVALLSTEPKRHLAPVEVKETGSATRRRKPAPLPDSTTPKREDMVPPLDSAIIPVIAMELQPLAVPVVPLASGSLNRTVVIPEYITVHLGPPSATGAQNVRVKFIDYIKNVASSEIYSTWPTNSLLANLHVIISFALNRVYTEWYPSRGFNYNITNSTAYDQAFRYGGPVYESISKLTDEVFNVYARRIGFRNPFFTQFCNGTTVTCAGLSQWGTVALANQGKTPLKILHNYYPRDLELVASDNIADIVESFPGTALRVGSQGSSVQRMQNFLNRIRVNFPLIPRISNPNGYFGTDTEDAVRTFQRTFNLTADGVIGRSTWNKINFIHVGVIRLAELDSEGERVGLSPEPPTVVLRQGSRGADVNHLQFLLNVIAPYYTTVPFVIKDSVFDSVTKNAVVAFQKTFGLAQDGVVGPATWNKLYAVYRGIEDNVQIPPTTPPDSSVPPFPGTLLRVGSSGANVRLMQTYLNTIRIVYQSIPYLLVDGAFGPLTRNAVIAFQREFNLAPDGIIGPITWNEIVQQFKIVSGGRMV